MGNKNSIDRKKTMLIIIGVSIAILLLGLTYFFTNKEKKKEEQYNSSISKLTDVYNENLSEKPVVSRNEEGELEYNDVVSQADKEIIGNVETDDNNKLLEDKLKEILDCINKKDYEKFYGMFNKDFLSDFNYNLDVFSAKYDFIGGALGEITNIYKSNKNIIFTVRFTEKNTGYIMITDFTLFEDDTIADISVYSVADLKKEKTVDKITYRIDRCYKNPMNSYYIIDIDNKSEYLLNIDDMLIKNNNSVCTYEYIGNEDDKTVYPGIPVRFIVKLYNTDFITDLTLQCIDINGNRKDIEIYKK